MGVSGPRSGHVTLVRTWSRTGPGMIPSEIPSKFRESVKPRRASLQLVPAGPGARPCRFRGSVGPRHDSPNLVSDRSWYDVVQVQKECRAILRQYQIDPESRSGPGAMPCWSQGSLRPRCFSLQLVLYRSLCITMPVPREFRTMPLQS
ncbi:hypothetical protein QAD02_016593 [Eretmocerus hayati]|uniref:Uncharacterized protein n=1 Tax=Eretmocerus hayati TaxID=131215 RepID=A0ACC2PCV1_9HYME|nr:hypothetical protein QAD02_016593 [Eretmocerus hayati]